MWCPGGPAWRWRLCTAGCRCGSTPTSPPPCTRWPGTRAWCTTSSTPASGHTTLFCDWLIMKILCSDWLTAPAPGCPRATPAWRWPSPSGSRRRRTPSRSGGGQSWTGGTFRLPFAICRSFFRSFPMVLLFLFILSANILLCRLTKFTLQYGSTGIPSKM